jgi:thioredoxin family protein/tetratricopeptide repeat protein
VYPNPEVVRFVNERFIPVRIHVREQADLWKTLGERYGVQWTPTTLIVDSSGEESHRIEGFLPADDFLAQLRIGAARSALANGRFADAEKDFQAVVEKYPNSEAAPEAFYWAGVSRYKGSGNAAALADTARGFRDRYQQSSWAKKASVWAS